MHSTRRSSLQGTTECTIVIIVTLLIMVFMAFLGQTNIALKNKNRELNNTVVELQKEKENLSTSINELEEENTQLNQEIDNILQATTPIGGTFKSYTDYRCLSRDSKHWKLQEQAYTDDNGLRKIDDAYLVALGSYYGTELGTQYIVTLSTGNTFKIMLCDQKKNIHTDDKNQVDIGNGSVLEFYVDANKLPRIAKITGTIGSIDFFSGEVISIVKI